MTDNCSFTVTDLSQGDLKRPYRLFILMTKISTKINFQKNLKFQNAQYKKEHQ